MQALAARAPEPAAQVVEPVQVALTAAPRVEEARPEQLAHALAVVLPT